MTPSLEAAAADVKADERARALEHLLGVWRAAPHPDVADRIVSLGATLPCDVDKKRWLEVAAKRRSADLSGLLAIGLDAPSATLRERVDQLATWPADPRIDRFLAHAYANPPYTSTGARPFWTGVVALAAKVQDVDALEAMKACRTQWSTAVPWQEFLRGHVDRVVKQAKVPGARALTAAQTDALAAIDAQLAAAGQKPRAVRSAEELERAIFEAPHDDSLRRVLMDTLLEQNHPRGALLALHTAAAGRELTAAEKKAEKALIQQHRAVLLGELEPVLKPDVSFAMGFVSRAALKQGSSNALKLAISKSVGLPAWATVQHLEGPGDDEVIAHPVMRSLVSSAASSAELRVLAAMPSLTDVELTLRGFADTFAASLQRLPARPFPALKRLRLTMDSLDHASAFLARVKLPRLERLVVEGEMLRGWMHSDEGVRRELKATAKAFVKHLLAVRADEMVLRVLYANDPRDVAADIVIRDRKATVVVAKSTRESPPRAVQTWDQIGEREVGQALEALVALGVPVMLSTHPKRPCDAAVFEALEARL